MIKQMRRAGRFNASLMDFLRDYIKPGIKTIDIDNLAGEFIKDHGHKSACIGYRGYPKNLCTSVNDVVCHGIPDSYELKDGDIVNVDISTIVDGYFGDQSEMFLIGEVPDKAKFLVQTCFDVMNLSIDALMPDCSVYIIGKTIQDYAESHGYSVVRDFCGHGIGKKLHQEPQIPHYKNIASAKKNIAIGMCFTIEPMINIGSWGVCLEEDGWTIKTKDKSLSAQFEHTILMTESGPEILTKTQNGPQKNHIF